MSVPVPRIFLNKDSAPGLRSRLLFAPRAPEPVPFYMGYRTGYRYPMSAPESDPNYVFVGNRDNFSGGWYPIGEPMTPEAVGASTYSSIQNDRVFGPQHHNINLSPQTRMNEEQLSQQLEGYGIQGEGNRENLFKQYINIAESPDLQGKLAQGESPATEEELRNIINRHHLSPLQEAEVSRRERRGVMAPHQNPSNQSWWQQSRINPRNWRSPEQTNPMRVEGTPVSNVEAQGIRQWGEQNLMQQLPQPNQNMMPLSQLAPQTAQGAGGQIGGAAAAGGMSRAATFASRALPMVNLALLAGSIMQASKQNRMQQQEEQRLKNRRV